MERIRNRRAAALAVLLLGLSGSAHAVRPGPGARDDARRFGLDRPATRSTSVGRSRRGRTAIRDFNRRNRGTRNLGYGAAAVGSAVRRRAQLGAREAARQFLRDHSADLGLRADELRLELARSAGGVHHLLFIQIVHGVPVEFSRTKVHVKASGEIIGVHSNTRKVEASPVPGMTDASAAVSVLKDLGAAPKGRGSLVFFPVRGSDSVRLAWKFRAAGAGGSWIYYVDAHSGEVLFRYSDLQFQAFDVCYTSGVITGNVYDLDPTNTPGPIARPIRHQQVNVYHGLTLQANRSTYSITSSTGWYCHGEAGRIYTALQGPYANVSNFNGPAVHYDNGGGEWRTLSSYQPSPHPYPNNSVIISTVNVPLGSGIPSDPYVLKALPHFASFDVGQVIQEAGDLVITDNDQVAVLDMSKNMVGTYVGERAGGFNAAAVTGRTYYLQLTTNESGSRTGFEVDISSYLVMTDNPATANNDTSSFTWTKDYTQDGSLDEINIFHHINLAHDYFSEGPNINQDANLDGPVPIMGRVGTMGNAFYDPEHGNLSFGDVESRFGLDASVVRHEYGHFIVDQIFPIINWGQNGALSEAFADYFAVASLAKSTPAFVMSKIGQYTAPLYNEGALRDLDCTATPPCKQFPDSWTGQIHDDSLIVSQALWELRVRMIENLGTDNGRTCTDGLVFQSLFYFPDSFQELLEAMLAVHDGGGIAACAGSSRELIRERFSAHGIHENPSDDDIYEPNDGIQTATDISTAAVISGRIYRKGDLDYFALGAGPGKIRLRLRLPEDPNAPDTYWAYTMRLIDQSFEEVASATPRLDVNPTFSGYCPESDCKTSQAEVVLEYDTALGGQFFLAIMAPEGDQSIVSASNSEHFYELRSDYPQAGPVTTNIVTASYDQDVISYSVRVASHVRDQNYTFQYAQLRDHALLVIPQTRTDWGGTRYLNWVSSNNALGRVWGTLQVASGFNNRFPAVGSVHVEIFGRNRLNHVQSLGFSPAVHMTAKGTSVTAYNNVFNPAVGEKATFTYELEAEGHVTMRLYTNTGRHVATLLDAVQPRGQGAVDWFGKNVSGSTVASGIYLLHVEGPGLNETKKVVIVK